MSIDYKEKNNPGVDWMGLMGMCVDPSTLEMFGSTGSNKLIESYCEGKPI